MLMASDLSVWFRKPDGRERVHVLDRISLRVDAGEYCSVIGPSGCGKTTILLAVAGLLQADSLTGTILWNHNSPEAVRQKHEIGFVFQRSPFFEWLTIRQNVCVTLRVAGIHDEKIWREQADGILDFFGLAGYEEAYPHQLSGGMLSRLALARALVHKPKYLILDEAFNHLDEPMRNAINADLERMRGVTQATAIAVTHNLDEAVFMSDTVAVLSQKPTRVTHTLRIPFSRPRSSELRSSAEFAATVASIRKALSDTYRGESA